MQKHIKDFVELVTNTVTLKGPIYEFGSLQVQVGDRDADLRALFEGKQFYGCDYRGGPGVDLVLDLHKIELNDKCAGTVISLDTLEHVEYPRKAMKEIHRILCDDGIVIISSVMNFPIHDYPYDYWRFTPQGFISLLSIFESSLVGSCGANVDFPQSIVGIGFKEATPDLDLLHKGLKKWEVSNSAIIKFLKSQHGP